MAAVTAVAPCDGKAVLFFSFSAAADAKVVETLNRSSTLCCSCATASAMAESCAGTVVSSCCCVALKCAFNARASMLSFSRCSSK
eukprot:6173632-Pleurochrysis_carterae.AAC.2